MKTKYLSPINLLLTYLLQQQILDMFDKSEAILSGLNEQILLSP